MNRRVSDHDEPVKAIQAALLEAFPETVAMLDRDGVIVAVNHSWRRFGAGNSPTGQFPGVGVNYLEVCDRSGGTESAEASDAAAGIRAVLDGLAPEFVLEYPCHTPTHRRWFRLIASPVRSGRLEAALVMHVDITDHKLATEHLRESQSVLAAASRIGRFGAWRYDVPTKALTWSEEMRAISEVPPGYLPTVEQAMSFYASDSLEEARESFQRCLQQGVPFDFKSRMITAKGRPRCIRVVGEAVRGLDGTVMALQGGLQDITSEVEMQVQLSRTASQMGSILENMSEGFYILDREWRFSYMNPQAARVLRCSAGDMIGRVVWDAWPNTQGTIVDDRFHEAVASGKPVRFENFYAPLGQWYEITALAHPDGLGVYFREITERKQSEERLRESQALLKAASRIGRLGAWRVDYPDQTLTWSDETKAIHGMGTDFQPTVEQAIGFYIPADRDRIAAAVSGCIQRGKTFDLKAAIVTALGRRVAVRVIGEPVYDAAGAITRIQGGFQDITEAEATHAELTRITGQLTSLLAHMSDAFFFVDREWRICYVNSEAERLMNTSQNGLVGRILWDARPHMVGTEIEAKYRRAMDTGQALHFETYYEPEKNWYELNVEPAPDGMGIYFRIVTARKEAEELMAAQARRLQETRTLLEAASRVSHLGAWRLDYPGPTVVWSDEVRIMHEVADDFQPTLEAGLDFYVPEDRPRIIAAITACQELGRPFDIKCQVVTAKGRRLWVRVIGEAVRDPNGSIAVLRGGFQDITESEETQAEVHRLERRLAATLEGMSDGFQFLDTQWNIAYLNDEAERLLHLRRQDVLGRSLWEVFPETDGLIHENYHRAMREQRPVKFEIYFEPLKNWFEIHAYPTQEGLAVYFHPVTDRKNAEEQLARQAERLRKSEEEYRLLFASNPQPMWVLDLKDLRFVAVNAAAISHYGYGEEEFLAMTVLDIRPTEDIPRFRALLAQKNIPIETGVHAHRKKDGTVIQVEVASDVVNFAGRPCRVAMINDVTARLQAEKEARRAQRLESVGTLAGGVAHDLNNLLSPIALGIGLLKETAQEPENLEAIATMESNAKRAATVVRQLLAFARGTEGERTTLQVQDVVAEVANIARNTFPKNIVIETRVAKDAWATVGDATQIHQVLLNLCLNARDAMPTGGKLKIRASRAEIDEHYAHMHREMAPGRFVLIEVADTGTGIEPAVMERMFEPFYTTKELGKGSGLGLSSSLGIVRAHGGFISPTSKVGKGSSFKVYLRAAASQEAEPVKPAIVLPRGKGELILLVDDELPILEITSKALRAFGYTVLTAEDGARALGLFAMHHERVALVLTDMMMAGMDGATLIATLKRMSPGVRVIAASGHNATDNAAVAVESGASDFLAKPYTAESMLTAIRSVLQDPPGAV